MSLFLATCQGIGLAIAVGTLAGASGRRGVTGALIAVPAAIGAAILFGISLSNRDHPAWPGWPVGILIAVLAFGVVSAVVAGAQASASPASAPGIDRGRVSRKLCLVVVDSLRTDMLLRAVAEDLAPHFGALLNRGTLIGDCVSSFPSVTPVACSEIATGTRPDRHHISGMNWFHRSEGRYVEYGSSLEATRGFGLFRTLYDTVYNLNMAHLSHEVETVFERLGDAGVRTACTPFMIYRGRRRHELGLEGLMRRVAVAANFRHAVWGPDELFYGELYASRRVPCKPTLARPGTRDAYSACVGRELVQADAYDFLLFSLPDNDHHTHAHGVDSMRDSIAHADVSLERVIDAAGGIG